MSESISAFFSSLFPGYKGQPSASPTRITPESRAVGSAPRPTATASSQPEATPTSSGPDATADGGGAGPAESELSREDIRKLRSQFLDKQARGQGKRKGATFSTPRGQQSRQN